MADELTPNMFRLMGTGSSNDSFGGSGFLMGLLLSRSGLFGNPAGEVAGAGVTVATINQAAQDAVQTILTAQNQAQTMQDVNRIPISVKDTQAALQHDFNNGLSNLSNQVNQSQLGMMTGQANIINSIDSHVDDISNQIERSNNAINAQFTAVNTAIANGTTAAALAAKDAQIQGLQNTQFLSQVTSNEADKTRTTLSAQIQSLSDKIDHNYIADLQGRLSDAKNQVTELSMEGRAAARTRDLEVNVTQNVNQNQLQMQQQQQTQYTNNLLLELLSSQRAVASNMNILGTQTGITQTPVNVGRV